MKPLILLALIVLSILKAVGWAKDSDSGRSPPITVYRSPTCGCCKKWVDHLKQHRFNVQDIVTDQVEAVKDKYGVPDDLASCHTAVVNGYAVEGHVPADDILKFLKTGAKVAGIAVPGMPRGSPGMESGAKDPYDVITFDRDHRITVFSKHPSK